MKLGLTGGIGSGKTTIAKVFETLQIPVFYADIQAKEILNTSQKLQNEIVKSFGNAVLTENKIDKQKLASIAFSNPENLKKLNKMIHPLVFEKYLQWLQIQSSSYTIMEAAIIFESGAEVLLDKIIFVDAPENTRIKRVMSRDNVNNIDVENRMKNQYHPDFVKTKADYIIDNSGDVLIMPQILSLHEKLMKICKIK